MVRGLLPIALAAGLTAGAWAAPSRAQEAVKVMFKPGNYGTMLNGVIKGDAYLDYKLRARAGQKLFAELSVTSTNGSGTAYFNILPPGSTGEAIYVGHMDTDRSALVTLPSNGEYTLRVYLMGNDRDAGKTVGYNLDLSIQ